MRITTNDRGPEDYDYGRDHEDYGYDQGSLLKDCEYDHTLFIN